MICDSVFVIWNGDGVHVNLICVKSGAAVIMDPLMKNKTVVITLNYFYGSSDNHRIVGN